MADQEKDKQMDEMLDSMLANYSSAEPRPGMETRILASVRDAEQRKPARPSWMFKGLWAAAAVAAAIIVVVVFIGGRQNVKQPPVVVKTAPTPVQPHAPQPSLPETVTVHPERHRLREAVTPGVESTRLESASLPPGRRPEVFPSPTPLSEQERLLLSYLTSTPREEIVAQSHPDEPPVIGQDQTEAVPDQSRAPQRFSNTFSNTR
jgi:hypothetical protein